MVKSILKVVLPLCVAALVSNCAKENPVALQQQQSPENNTTVASLTPEAQGPIAVAKDKDNKMLLIASSLNNQVNYRKQTDGSNSNSAWAATWTPITGTSSIGNIVMVRNWKDSNDLYVINSNHQLAYSYEYKIATNNGPLSWKSWVQFAQPSGRTITGNIAAIYNPTQKCVYVFARASDNYLYYLKQNASAHTFGSWTKLGKSQVSDQVAVALRYNGAIAVFTQDFTSGGLKWIRQNTASSSFDADFDLYGSISDGYNCTGYLRAQVNCDKGISVFISRGWYINGQQASDIIMQQQYMRNGYDAGWLGVQTLVDDSHGQGFGNMDAFTNKDGRLEIVWWTSHGPLAHLYQTTAGDPFTWSAYEQFPEWANLGSNYIKGASFYDGNPGFFGHVGGNIGYQYFSSGMWQSWIDFGNN